MTEILDPADVPTAGDGGAAGSAYRQFSRRVAAAQLAHWLPHSPCRVLDLSDAADGFDGQLVAAGHDVLSVRAPGDRLPVRSPARAPADLPAGLPAGIALGGRQAAVVADRRSLGWLREGSVDAVLAESRLLSLCLAAEVAASDLARTLRPGGRMLLVVDSLTGGLARLADQGRWAELADAPSADVLLVPQADDTITRAFFPAELAELLVGAGLTVEWIRPRTVLAPAAVERAVAEGGERALGHLVRTECALAREREGEAVGRHLVASARRPG